MSWQLISQIFIVAIMFIISVMDYKWHDKRTKKFRLMLRLLFILLAALLIAGGVSTIKQTLKNDQMSKDLEKVRDTSEKQAKEITRLNNLVALMNVSIGDLAKLNEMSKGQKYYVRIAAGRTKEELQPYLRNIDDNFKGAIQSGMATIRPPHGKHRQFELIFGQHLDLAGAEVFHRLAMSHRFTEAGQIAQIIPESP